MDKSQTAKVLLAQEHLVWFTFRKIIFLKDLVKENLARDRGYASSEALLD